MSTLIPVIVKKERIITIKRIQLTVNRNVICNLRTFTLYYQKFGLAIYQITPFPFKERLKQNHILHTCKHIKFIKTFQQ